MSLVEKLLSAAGIDPRQDRAAAAALIVRRLPLRMGGDPAGSRQQTIERGWCAGPEDQADLLSVITGAEGQQGEAFGSVWPWFECEGSMVAPGLPVRLPPGVEEEGPDGMYERAGGGVFREAAGRRYRLMTTRSVPAETEPNFSLLWFSDDARYLVRNDALEVEDLFSKTRCWIDKGRLEGLLVRKMRLEAGAIEGLEFAGGRQSTTVEVSRTFDFENLPWRDPRVYLENRIDVSSIESRGGNLVFADLRGETVEFRTEEHDSGWLIVRQAGRFPFEALRFEKQQAFGTLEATLAAEVDIFSPGIRGRVVFDLNADLSALIRRYQKV